MNDIVAQLKPYRSQIGTPLLFSIGMSVLAFLAASDGRKVTAIIGAFLAVSMFVRAMYRLVVARRDIAQASD